MSCTERITRELHARGYRITPQRLAILRILHAGGHLTPIEVHDRSRETLPGMTEATVYRTLEFLAENGAIFAAHTESGRQAYEIASHKHHHLVCRACGAQMEIEHALLENLYNQLESASGFQLFNTGHLTFLGLCPQCQKGNGGI